MFKFIISTLLFATVSFSLAAQIKISPYLMGQNAWGRGDIFRVQEEIKQVKYQTIRIGGNGYENAGFMIEQAIKYIDYARSVGAEPFLQMPRQLRNDDKAYKILEYW